MLEQVQYYFIPITACVCFIAFLFAGKSTPMGRISDYFIVGTAAVLCIILCEMLESYFSPPNCVEVNWQRWLFSIAAYILRPGVAYILLLIPLRKRKRKYSVIAAVPLMVNTLFLLISPFCGIVFSYTDSNSYTSGPFKFLPFAVGFIYLALLLTFVCVDSRGGNRMTWISSVPVVVMCAVAVFLESGYDMLGSLPMACIIGMVFYYVYFFMDFYMKDSLSGAYQRGRLYQDVKRDGPRYFIIFDMNGLKRINDGNGHMKGDRAIESFGRTVLSVLPDRADFYRIGGDEFAVIYSHATEDEVNSLLREIIDALDTDDLPYSISYGYSSFDSAESFNTAYRSADMMLYANKQRFWEKYNLKEEDEKETEKPAPRRKSRKQF